MELLIARNPDPESSQARPDVRIPTARAAGIADLEIVVHQAWRDAAGARP